MTLRQRVHVDSETRFLASVPHSSPDAAAPLEEGWSLLVFNHPDLPETFTVRIVDEGDGWGERSAVALKADRHDRRPAHAGPSRRPLLHRRARIERRAVPEPCLMQAVWADFAAVVSRWRVWHLMAFQDILMRYRRSAIGPFWISMSMAAMVFGIALLYSQIFDTEFKSYLAWLAVSFLVWGFLSSSLIEGCSSLVEAEAHLRSVRLPAPVLAARVVWRNTVILLHNLIVIALVLVYAGVALKPTLALAVPGFALVAAFAGFAAVALGPLNLRFRDIGQIVASLIQIMFFITPVIWTPDQGRLDRTWVDINPLYHLMELVRAPALGAAPTADDWLWGLGATTFAAALAVVVNAASRRKVYVWL